jgi:hypothetical protein
VPFTGEQCRGAFSSQCGVNFALSGLHISRAIRPKDRSGLRLIDSVNIPGHNDTNLVQFKTLRPAR